MTVFIVNFLTAYQALVFYNPRRIAITGGYHGCHMTIEVVKQLRPDLKIINLDDSYENGDLCWLETPLNPTGEVRSAAVHCVM
jgi:cystathionine gamma-synthase